MKAVTALTLVLMAALATPSLAEKGGDPHKGKGHDKARNAHPGKPHGHAPYGKFGTNDQVLIRSYYGRAVGHGYCPPGLAKKGNGCLPPGHAKRYVVGHPLPLGVRWYAVPHDLVVRLTPPPYGFRYVYLDGGVLLLNLSTRVIVDAVSIGVTIR